MHKQDSRFERPAATNILARLEAWGLDRHGRARCPAHNGGDRNLSVRRAGDKVLLCCHSHGCTYEQILAGLGIDPPPPPDILRKQPSDRLAVERSEFPYFDADGNIVVTVIRVDFWRAGKRDKDIWRYPKGAEPPPGGWPLYRLPSLLIDRSPLLIVEGERTAEAAQFMLEPHYQATCTIGGAGKAAGSDLRPVEGRECIIWPDADGPGRSHAADLGRLCREHGATSVRIVPTDDLAPGWDLADD